MQSTVRICGVDYPDCELIQHGARWGIKTPDKNFWPFLICDENGKEIESLPPWLPREIRPVTVETPDLTQRHPNTVKELFDKRLAYFTRVTTLEAYLKDSSGNRNPPVDQAAFEAGRKRILSESLDDFTRDPLLRKMVWDRHGTQEIANQCGYLGDVWETEVSENGAEHRVSRDMSIMGTLASALMAARRIGDGAAWVIVGKLKYVMIYDGVPTPQFIYLEALKESPRPPHDARIAVDLRAQLDSRSRNEVRLDWKPASEKLDAILQDTQALLEKKKKQKRKWYQERGKATAKWRPHQSDVKGMCQHARKFIKRDKKGKIVRGTLARAVTEAKGHWKRNHQDPQMKRWIDEGVSISTLERWMLKDWRKD